MKELANVLVSGAVTIGIITALVLPGRRSVELVQTAFKGGSSLFGTVISGKAS